MSKISEDTLRKIASNWIADVDRATIRVVSLVTAQAAAASSRRAYDLLTPGQQIRDAQGRVIGCASLARAQIRTEFTWREREAFRLACLAAGGSTDVSAEFRGHGGRYPRNYAGDVRLTVTFWASPRRGGGVLTLTEVPFHDTQARTDAYEFLASAGATANDANEAERAQARQAVEAVPEMAPGWEDRAVERARREGVIG